MTMTVTAPGVARTAAISRETATRLAATEYDRFVALLRDLRPEDWAKPTDCPLWDVRAVAAHTLGMVEMVASLRVQLRQNRTARSRRARDGGTHIDALTAVQVEERAGMSPEAITARLAARAPQAVRGRRRKPALIRRRTLPGLEQPDGSAETWTIGYLLDVILTRDPWMHRVDITRATGAAHVLTPEHDGVIVADVVLEWAGRHGQPYRLHLTGPAGGEWSSGSGGPDIAMDAVDFCRAVSGRGPATGLLTTEVPF